jgi:hypothetical protein
MATYDLMGMRTVVLPWLAKGNLTGLGEMPKVVAKMMDSAKLDPLQDRNHWTRRPSNANGT